MLHAGDKIDSYTLIEELGKGSFGVVWLAEERTVFDAAPKVALKIALDDRVDMSGVEREAQLWVAASGHINVLPIWRVVVSGDQVVIVSEYAREGSLENWLTTHDGRAPSIGTAVEMISGILAGLGHLHSSGIIHRDLKPSNILLQGEVPRLTDFGLARLSMSSTHSMHAAGTLAYMAPEVFSGGRSEQSDIWAAGVIFYQMLDGRLPFPQQDIRSLINAIDTHEPVLPASVPDSLKRIIATALQKLPADRYQSANEMRQALRDINPIDWAVMQTTSTSANQSGPAKPETASPAGNLSNLPSTPLKTIEAWLPPTFPLRDALVAEHVPIKASRWRGSKWHWKPILGVVVLLLLGLTILFGINRLRLTFAQKEASVHSLKGDALSDRSQFAEAEAEYRNAIRLDPGSALYRVKLAMTMWLQGQSNREVKSELEEAERLARESLESAPELNYFSLGKSLLTQGKYADGEKALREAIHLNPHEAEYHHDLSFFCLFSQERYPEAESEVREAIRLKPDYFDYHDTLGQVLAAQARYAEAEREFRRAIQLNPASYWVHEHLGDVLLAHARCKQSAEAYDEALRHYALAGRAQDGLADIAYRQGNYSKEETGRRLAIKASPEAPNYHAKLGQLLEEQSRADEAKAEFDQAEARFREIITLGLDESNARSAFGDFLFNRKRYDEAQKEYEAAVGLAPERASYHVTLGNFFYSREQKRKGDDAFQRAEFLYREGIRLNPNEPAHHITLANFLFDRNRDDEARAQLEKAISLSPNEAEYYFYLGNWLMGQKEYQAAASKYEKSVQLNPNEGDYRVALADALMNLNQDVRAEFEYRRALELSSDDASYHNALGDLFFKAKRYSDSEMAYREATKLNPTRGLYWNNLAASLSWQRRSSEADPEYRKAVEVEPKVANYWANLSQTLEKEGKHAEALAAQKKAKRLTETKSARNPLICR